MWKRMHICGRRCTSLVCCLVVDHGSLQMLQLAISSRLAAEGIRDHACKLASHTALSILKASLEPAASTLAIESKGHVTCMICMGPALLYMQACHGIAAVHAFSTNCNDKDVAFSEENRAQLQCIHCWTLR